MPGSRIENILHNLLFLSVHKNIFVEAFVELSNNLLINNNTIPTRTSVCDRMINDRRVKIIFIKLQLI